MKTRIVFGCLFALLVVEQQVQAQTDPTLAGMITSYTDKARDQLKAQEKAMLMRPLVICGFGRKWKRPPTCNVSTMSTSIHSGTSSAMRTNIWILP